jgi:ribose transport system ATP-binding protein
MIKLMVGRDLAQFYQRQEHQPGPPVLEVARLRTAAYPRQEISLRLRSGEIVGLAGLVGAGRTELLRVLFGIDPALGGGVQLEGRALALRNPVDAIRAGLALVPEDRKEQGLILEMAVRHNLSLASLRRDQRRGFISWTREQALSRRLIEQLSIRTPSPEQITQYLSGGNQQKIALGKWLALAPKVLLLDEPTRGVDVGAKQEIYRLMEELAGRGVAILFVSSEMEEILNMSDRVLVMHEGRLSGELSRSELSEQAVMHLATGAPGSQS